MYIKSFYTGKLDLSHQNCVDFYYIADFFQDDGLLNEISDFIREHITFKKFGQANELF